MSILKTHRTIGYGDTVILYGGREDVHSITVTKGAQFNGKRGHFNHDDLVGKDYGSSYKARKGISGKPPGMLSALLPTAELWTWVVHHRTQILYLPPNLCHRYPTDNSYIVMGLDLKPGSRVVESGTAILTLRHWQWSVIDIFPTNYSSHWSFVHIRISRCPGRRGPHRFCQQWPR